MKTVVIPNDRNPFEVEINGTEKYSYPAGTTQTVPDAVAEIIEQYNARLQKPNAPFIRPSMPTAGADGDALVSVGGKWEKQDGYGYENIPFEAIEWDGVAGDREKATFTVSGIEVPYYKVSDYSDSVKNNLVGGKLHANVGETYDITSESVYAVSETCTVLLFDIALAIVASDSFEGTVDGMDISVPSAGVYFADVRDIGMGAYISKLSCNASAKKIASKYLPNSVKVFQAEVIMDGLIKEYKVLADDGSALNIDVVKGLLASGTPVFIHCAEDLRTLSCKEGSMGDVIATGTWFDTDAFKLKGAYVQYYDGGTMQALVNEF